MPNYILMILGNFRRLHIFPTLIGLIIFYSGLIPISLNITLEMIQLFQAYFIQQVCIIIKDLSIKVK